LRERDCAEKQSQQHFKQHGFGNLVRRSDSSIAAAGLRHSRAPFPNPTGLPSLSPGLIRAGLAIRLRLTSAGQVGCPGSSANRWESLGGGTPANHNPVGQSCRSAHSNSPAFSINGVASSPESARGMAQSKTLSRGLKPPEFAQASWMRHAPPLFIALKSQNPFIVQVNCGPVLLFWRVLNL